MPQRTGRTSQFFTRQRQPSAKGRDVAAGGAGELGEGGDCCILLTSFDLPDVGSVHVGFEREFFLRKPLGLSRLPNPLADYSK